jgi:putative membrane protein
MRQFLVHWVSVSLALAAAAWLLPGVWVDSWGAVLLGGLVLGFVNAVIRPVLVVLTLPVTVLTLGLFLFVVNAAAFGLAAALTPGFHVASWGQALLGALVTSAVSWLLSGDWFVPGPSAADPS